MWLTRLAVRHPITASMLLLSLLVLGAISLFHLPLNFLPNENFPQIQVVIPYANGIPAQVEREIARPVEEQLSTLGGVKQITSYSDPEQCTVSVEFDWGRDVNVLRLEVKEKLDQIRADLPPDVRDVFLYTFNTNDIPIVEGRISAKDRDLSGSYDLIQHRILNRLQRIPGVGRVQVHGVEPAVISVYLKLDQIKEHRVDVGRLFSELASSNFNLTVGQVTKDGLRYDIRSMGAVSSIEELENLPLDDRGLRLRDVADVVYAVPEQVFGRFLNDEPAVAFWIQRASDANTVQVVEAVRKELDRINHDPQLAGIDVLMFFDQGEQIKDSLNGLLHAGTLGAILAVGILYFFLLRLGTTLIVALAIPISTIGTACYLYLSGKSLNVLSMMGLMLAVGMLVDNAVVVLESIYRRLGLGESPVEATLHGTRDVGRAVTSATLSSIIVFAPIILAARTEITVWLKEVGIAISVTLLMSLLVSLTLIPMLTSHLLKGGKGSVAKNPLVERWCNRYVNVLRWTSIRHPWITGVPIALGVLIVTIGAAKVAGLKPDPFSERGSRHEFLEVDYDFKDNCNYRVTRQYVQKVQDALRPARESLGVKDVYSWYEDNNAATRLYFKKGVLSEKDLSRMRDRVRKLLPTLAGVEFHLGQEDSQQQSDRFAVTIHGEDSEALLDIAAEVKRRLALVPVVHDLTTDVDRGAQEVQVRVDPNEAGRFDLSPRDVAQVMGIAFRGVDLPRVHAMDREVDLRVALRPEDRQNLEDLRALTVSMSGGREISLEQVADAVVGRAPSRIQRLDQQTAVRVYGRYDGTKFSDVMDEIEATMNAMHFPPGYGWNFGEEIRRAQEQQAEMGTNTLLAIICVYMVMASLFESLLHPAVIMACLPFAGVGVIWLMVLTHTPFNIMAMIGMVILIGVVVNNGIVLIDHVNHHRRDGRSIEEAILLGGRERFRPILMTATTTILGLIPLSLGGGYIGDVQMYPMARALIGGMSSSTLLTLLMLPTYYMLAEKMRVLVPQWAKGSVRLPGKTWRAAGRLRRRWRGRIVVEPASVVPSTDG
jgi:hydrophobic/amphiphilic exporter-1 (mainly G- bacteria), HAE1 family